MENVENSDVTNPKQQRFSHKRSIKTDVGRRRSENQDSFGVLDTSDSTLLIVADGMGGVNGGGRASSIAALTIARSCLNPEGTLSEHSLVKAIELANKRILYTGQSSSGFRGMGTTVVALAIKGRSAFWAHVGDSRLYLVRDSQIKQLTKDHTLVQELVDSGMIPPDRAANHPIGHMLTRALGQSEEVDIDIDRLDDQLQIGDRFLLCCDGLTAHVSESEILDILEQLPTEQVADELVNLANSRGGTDNTTVIAICLEQADSDLDPASDDTFAPTILLSCNLSAEEESNLFVDEPPLISDDIQNEEEEIRYEEMELPETLLGLIDDDNKLDSSDTPSMLRALAPNSNKRDYLKSLPPPSTTTDNFLDSRFWNFILTAPYNTKIIISISVFCCFLMGAMIFSLADSFFSRNYNYSASPASENSSSQMITELKTENENVQISQASTSRSSDLSTTPKLLDQKNDGLSRIATTNNLIDHTAGLLSSAIPNQSGEINPELLESICNIKELYRERIADLHIRLRLIDLPISEVETQLARLEERFSFISGLLDEANSNLSAANEQLSSWKKRKLLIEGEDAGAIIRVLDEIGDQDQFINAERDTYRNVAFRYFRAVELWNSNPGDLSLRTSMESLGTEMREKKKSLDTLMLKVANEKIQQSLVDIADWTLAIAGINRQKQRVAHELSLTKTYIPYEPDTLERTRKALVEERDTLLGHMNSLSEKVTDQMEESFKRNKILSSLKPNNPN